MFVYIAGEYDYFRSIFHQFGVKAIEIVSFLGLEVGLGNGITYSFSEESLKLYCLMSNRSNA